MVDGAVARLPEPRRERLGEEWRAALADMPTPISQIVFAIGVRIAAERIRSRDSQKHVPKLRINAGILQDGHGAGGLTTAAVSVLPVSSRRLQGALWFVTCVAITLGFYAVSIKTMRTRARVEAAEVSIVRAKQDIAALEARLAARNALRRANSVQAGR